jgi:Phage P22-like portal protein
MKKRDKIISEARDRYKYAREAWGPIYAQAADDRKFSDPTSPQQWPEKVKREREMSEGGPRPCLTFDQTNQFIRQVVNQARRNKPALKFLPVDDQSDPRLAEILQGLARQVEYESKADSAYIQSLDHAARGGIGWFRLITEEVQGSEVAGQQRAKIQRVVTPDTILVDPDFVEADGSDMGWGFAEEMLAREEFKRRWPKAEVGSWDEDGWCDDKHVRVCDYYRVVERAQNFILAGDQEYSEDDYWEAAKADPSLSAGTVVPRAKTKRVVEVYKLTGEEVLEQSEFPAEFVPIFPVLGNESWEDGKRKLSGAIRLIRDSQVAYNYERNSEIEAVAIAPKAPWLAPVEAIEGHENLWRRANHGNLAVLPYNSLDENGQPIAKPERIQPAGLATGFIAASDRSKADIQSGLGMFNAAVGNNPNNQSGRAVLALQDKAEVGTFHYIDNLAIAISHLGRVLTQVWSRIYDQPQIIRIIGEDEASEFVQVAPGMGRPYVEQVNPLNQQRKILIDFEAGRYDARAVVGPAYATRQTEAAAEISELVNGNPQMMAILGDVWVKMRNFPEADKIARRMQALLPDQIKAAEGEGQQQLPPQVQQALQSAAQQIQALQAQLQEAQSGIQSERMRAEMQLQIAQIKADAQRDVQELKGVVDLLKASIQPPQSLAANVSQDLMRQ